MVNTSWKRLKLVNTLAIPPNEYDSKRHRLPVAGELLLPGVQAYVRADGVAFALKQALLPAGAHGIVIELSRRGEVVELAVNAQRQEDGGYFFEALWVLVG